MISMELFTKLFEIFPEAFSAKKEYKTTVTINTPWGVEYEEGETKTAILAELILNTAQGIANAYGMDHAIEKYLMIFANKRTQQQELRNFNR